MSGLPRVYTIPPGAAFLDAIAAEILRETAGDPDRLAGYTLLLPTRRAARAMAEAFLRLSGGRALLLPRLTPLGDVDEDSGPLAADEEVGASFDLPPAIPPLRRTLLLAELIRKLPADEEGRARGPEEAALLAQALGHLIDEVETERLDFSRLAGLVPESYAAHWGITLEFLELVTAHWPRILETLGAVDPARRRNLALDARAELWRVRPPEGPVIAAGSTGSVPATAELLALVASLPQGRVVLPGLDLDLTESDAWDLVGPTHPQFAMKRLLERFGIERHDVMLWPVADAPPRVRARLIVEAMRPAETTDAWRRLGTLSKDSLAGLARVECPSPREEAGTIALLMREALETPGRTAALVTPDRALARRVAAELARWEIEIDDSAGTPLDATPPGAYLRLVAEAAAEDLAPLALIALLKHPLAAGGIETARFRHEARLLELAILRGPRPQGGFDGLRAALKSIDARHRAAQPVLGRLVARLEKALGPLVAALAKKSVAPATALEAHIAAAEALAASETENGAARLWAGEAGETASRFVAELGEALGDASPIEGGAYPGLFATLLAGGVVRPRYGRHPRLFIWGPLEARLQRADLTILGGLNEGTWPRAPAADPWMSRPMRKDFGLAEPERRIGLAAHDFAQACAAPEVVLTRALKLEGAPTVPARWLARLDNLLAAVGLGLARDLPARGWFELLDAPQAPALPIEPPAPRPPVAARPRKLSVTEIETWMRDPYAIYARHVLRLEPLDPADADPGAAERGSFIHEALARFVEAHPADLPADALGRLLEIGRASFGAALERPGVRAFWWPRFERIARWFVAEERLRRVDLAACRGEVRGSLTLKGPAGPFILEGRADRIDRLEEGGLAIVDYKTGSVPGKKIVELGLAPQLPLEAAMAEAGAFERVAAETVASLEFWALSRSDADEVKVVLKDPPALAKAARAGLERLIAAFDDAATPYRAEPRPEHAPRFGDYAHLARVKEWSAEGSDE
ncbi:MAG TPA: double-strand break repair protein AddB [Alphaproteobacteria bacterium]|nr:double-strand break repair protein AddB [Alphaproteobacteria bacterium]